MSIKTEDDTKDYIIDALKTELESALRVLTQTLLGTKTANDAAWWLSANHARFIIDHPNLDAEKAMIVMAAGAGTPPKGENWQDWYDRVRKLKPPLNNGRS